jgi:hypothetical protein
MNRFASDCKIIPFQDGMTSNIDLARVRHARRPSKRRRPVAEGDVSDVA